MDDDNEKSPSLFKRVFGKEITQVPCFKDSYYYGIWSGIGGGFAYFMFTSKVRMASHFGMATFCITTLSYWSYCRWNLSKQIQQAAIAQRLLQEHIAKEGAAEIHQINDKPDRPLIPVTV